jgi:hypothetical protein
MTCGTESKMGATASVRPAFGGASQRQAAVTPDPVLGEKGVTGWALEHGQDSDRGFARFQRLRDCTPPPEQQGLVIS